MAEGGTDSLYRTEQRIRIISTSEEANQVIKAHVASEPVIGFDCEWNSRSEQSERIALVQIATRQHVFLLRLFKMAQMPAELVALLRNRNVLKVGVNIEVDKKKLQQQRGCIVEGIVDLRSLAFNSPSYGQVLFQQLQVLNMKTYGMAEADQISKKATWMPKMGLGPMVQDCLGVALNKSGTARWQDDWEVEALAPNQVEYAAGDAASALEIFYAFLSKRRLGCRVDVTKEIVDRTTVEELVKGLVDIPPSKKNKAIKQRALDCVLRIEPTFNITPYYYKPQDAQQSGMRLESARPPRIREPRAARRNQSSQCRLCGETGHSERDCPKHRVRDTRSSCQCRACQNYDGSDPSRSTPGSQYENCRFSEGTLHSATNAKLPMDTKRIASFGALPLSRGLATKLDRELKPPTRVQQLGIPLLQKGGDVVLCSQTGTGKTAAYLIPIIDKILREKIPLGTPRFFIVAPTRELALQIDAEFRRLSENLAPQCESVVVIGRSTKRPRVGNCHLVVGTPGKVRSMIVKGDLDLTNIDMFVVDEFDRMLEKGFIEDVRLFYQEANVRSQMLMASATWNHVAMEAAKEFLKEDFVRLQIGAERSAQTTVEQKFELLKDVRNKTHRLREILVKLLEVRAERFTEECKRTRSVPSLKDFLLTVLSDAGNRFQKLKVLCFFETKEGTMGMTYYAADMIFSHFKGWYYKNFPTAQPNQENGIFENFGIISINGALEQRERQSHLKAFSDGIYSIMFATNVAARGLDPPRITHIINYDLPSYQYLEDSCLDEYIHRIGRTGRLGNSGQSISFFLEESDSQIVGGVVRILANSHQHVPDWLQQMAQSALTQDMDRLSLEREGRHHGGAGGFVKGPKKKRTGGTGGAGGAGPSRAAKWNDEMGPNETELWGGQ